MDSSTVEIGYKGYVGFVEYANYPDNSRNFESRPYETSEKAYEVAKKRAESYGFLRVHYGVRYNIDKEDLIVEEDQM